MAKINKKQRKTKPQPTATQIAADGSMSADTRKHAAYAVEGHGERDKAGGVIDGHHLRRIACARGLEGFVKANARRRTIVITQPMLDAASAYQADVEASHGSHSHELRPFVDRKADVQLVSQKRIDAAKRVAGINRRMNPTTRVIVDAVLITHPDQTLPRVFAPLTGRKFRAVKERLLDGLAWLAVEYGYASNNERPLKPSGEA